jgi:hypothetical protein
MAAPHVTGAGEDARLGTRPPAPPTQLRVLAYLLDRGWGARRASILAAAATGLRGAAAVRRYVLRETGCPLVTDRIVALLGGARWTPDQVNGGGPRRGTATGHR